MRIVFIHAGSQFHNSLGSHYEELIKHSMHLLPLQKYLHLPREERHKYRSIESLTTGHIIGVALIDHSFYFNADHLQNPWAQGPYCYNILDAIRLEHNIKCSGKMGVWGIRQCDINKIKLMKSVMNKINEWLNKYEIDLTSKYGYYSAFTIMQPFAEGIIRKIKNIENRKMRTFSQIGNKEGQFEGCRVCVQRKLDMIETINYEKYGQPFISKKQMELHGHYDLPRYSSKSASYHKTAIITNCACSNLRKTARKKKINTNSKSMGIGKRKQIKNTNTKRKIKKLALKPLPNYNNMRRSRKPSRRSRSKYASKWYDSLPTPKPAKPAKSNNNVSRDESIVKLMNMGYDFDKALNAANKNNNVEHAVDYLHNLDRIQKNVSRKSRLGYSDNLSKMKLKQKESNNNMNMNSDNGEIVKQMKERKKSINLKQNGRKRKRRLSPSPMSSDDEKYIDSPSRKRRKIIS